MSSDHPANFQMRADVYPAHPGVQQCTYPTVNGTRASEDFNA